MGWTGIMEWAFNRMDKDLRDKASVAYTLHLNSLDVYINPLSLLSF